MPPTTYPGSTWNVIKNREGLAYVDSARWRVVIHATVTKGLPRYTSPPHITINPITGQTWQHVPFTKGAYALRRNVTQTNRQHAIQVEIIDADGDASEWDKSVHLAKLLQWFLRHFPIKAGPLPVFSTRRCYGTKSICRMTTQAWVNFNSFCGHQHVPDNTHWDPGPFDVAGLLTMDTGEPMEHDHTPPAGETHEWADRTWDQWVERSDTNPDSRGWNFQREDLSWVYDRIILPLEKRAKALEETVAAQQRMIGTLSLKVDGLESSEGIQDGDTVQLTVVPKPPIPA